MSTKRCGVSKLCGRKYRLVGDDLIKYRIVPRVLRDEYCYSPMHFPFLPRDAVKCYAAASCPSVVTLPYNDYAVLNILKIITRVFANAWQRTTDLLPGIIPKLQLE